MNIAICDDDIKWIEKEEEYLSYWKEMNITCNSFYNGEQLIEAYKNKNTPYDLIFLDMEMENMSGIEVADKIRRLDKYVYIVFVTNHEKYMKESFKCLPFDFLVKPVEFEEFSDVFNRVIKNLKTDKKALLIEEDRKSIRLLYNEILFVQSINHCIYIQTFSKTYKTYKKTMSEISKELSDMLFVQVHKSYIVNMNHIRELSKNELKLRDYTHPIPLGGSYKETAKKKIILFEERKYLL